MPKMDGTGPQGQGAMTGRGFGPCGSGFFRGCCRGLGRGFGRGLGCRRQVNLTKADEKKILEAELEEIETEKQEIEQRLKEMK